MIKLFIQERDITARPMSWTTTLEDFVRDNAEDAETCEAVQALATVGASVDLGNGHGLNVMRLS